MRGIERPTPIRLWGFLLTVAGGAQIGFGAVLDWGKVAFHGTTVNAIPTKGVDLAEGKAVLAAGVAVMVGILALRLLRSHGSRRLVSIGIITFSLAAGALTLSVVARSDSVFEPVAIDAEAHHIFEQIGLPVDLARRRLLEVVQQEGIGVRYQWGLYLTLAGSAVGILGGVFDLAWVGRKRLEEEGVPSAPAGEA